MSNVLVENGLAFGVATGHPLRFKILLAIQKAGQAGPKGLSELLEESLPLTSYHVKILKKGGLLELVGTEPRRGAIAHFYELTDKSRLVLAVIERMEKEPAPPKRRPRRVSRAKATA